jgi:hypothetical protein
MRSDSVSLRFSYKVEQRRGRVLDVFGHAFAAIVLRQGSAAGRQQVQAHVDQFGRGAVSISAITLVLMLRPSTMVTAPSPSTSMPTAALDHQRGVLVDADAVQIRVLRHHRQQARQALAFGEVLVDHHPVQEAEAGAEADRAEFGLQLDGPWPACGRTSPRRPALVPPMQAPRSLSALCIAVVELRCRR